ncbi:MAG: hypothetical protein WCX95_00280 [Candidatus Gracilibacteria bacterium]
MAINLKREGKTSWANIADPSEGATLVDHNATTADESGKGIDNIALEGAEKLAARKQKYIADRVPRQDGNISFTRSEKIQKAEAYFVGNAFDEINRAISASALDDEERDHLMDQVILGKMPVYGIFYNSGRKPYAVVTIPDALIHAAKNNPQLIGAILKADSYARAMSPSMIGGPQHGRVAISEQNAECLLINALITNGKNSRGENIDFARNQIEIDMSVDDTDFAQKEKENISETETAESKAKTSLEALRKAEKPALKAFEAKMESLVADAAKGIEEQKQVLTEVLQIDRAAIATTKESLPALFAKKRQEALASIEKYVAAAKEGEERSKREELVNPLKTLISTDGYTAQQLEDTLGKEDGYSYPPTLAKKLKDDAGKEVIDAGRGLISQMRLNAQKENSIQRANESLEQIGLKIEEGKDMDASTGYGDRGSLKYTLYSLDSCEVGIDGKILREAITELDRRMRIKQRAEQTDVNAKRDLGHIGAALSGNKDGLLSSYSSQPRDIETAWGLEEAIKREKESLRTSYSGEEYVQVVATIDAIKASMSDYFGKVRAAAEAKQQYQRAVKEQTRQTQIASLSPVWQEKPEIIMGLYYLKKRVAAENPERGESRPYRDDRVAFVPYSYDEKVEISLKDIGAYVDANNQVIFNGKAPGLCKKLEDALEAHIGDFDLEAGAGPLTVAAIQRIASERVKEAGKARDVADNRANQWGGDLKYLAQQTMDLDERNVALVEELDEKRKALEEAQAAVDRAETQIREARGELGAKERALGEARSSLEAVGGSAQRLAREAEEAKAAAGTATSTGEAKVQTLAEQIAAMNAELKGLRKIKVATDTYTREMAAAEKLGVLSRGGAKKAAQRKLDTALSQLDEEQGTVTNEA